MWRKVRIAVLLLVLVIVAGRTWLDRVSTQSWKAPLYVGIYPLNADGTPEAQKYVESLSPDDFMSIETFFDHEGQQYGLKLEQPIHLELYPQGRELPPQLENGSGLLGVMAWSLKLRWFAMHAADVPGHPKSRIRLFVLYHNPATLPVVPDSHGLQKGLVGVVHAFAVKSMSGSNNIVIAHELLHTLGATDKYDPNSGAPLYPEGYGDPDSEPRYPQATAEIMAGQRAISPSKFEMPTSLRDVVVGPVTAREIRWTH